MGQTDDGTRLGLVMGWYGVWTVTEVRADPVSSEVRADPVSSAVKYKTNSNRPETRRENARESYS